MIPWSLEPEALHEPWRLWACHLAHYDLAHALCNLIALTVPLLLLDRQGLKRFGLWLPLLAPLLSLALMPFLQGGSYCGASGLACAAWAFAGLRALSGERRALGLAMLTLLLLKCGAEICAGTGLLAHGGTWASLAESHLCGTLLGLLAAKVEEVLQARSLRLRFQIGSAPQRGWIVPR